MRKWDSKEVGLRCVVRQISVIARAIGNAESEREQTKAYGRLAPLHELEELLLSSPYDNVSELYDRFCGPEGEIEKSAQAHLDRHLRRTAESDIDELRALWVVAPEGEKLCGAILYWLRELPLGVRTACIVRAKLEWNFGRAKHECECLTADVAAYDEQRKAYFHASTSCAKDMRTLAPKAYRYPGAGEL